MRLTRPTASRRRGFTLIELMIVVAIIAILASLAVASYITYVNDARRSTAESFLGVVRGKQELYNSRFGRYLTAAANPTAIPEEGEKEPWENQPGWISLGATPRSSAVGWQYSTGGGTGACTPGGGAGHPPADVAGACGGLTSGSWYWAIARNQKNGTPNVILVTNSARDQVWVIE